MKRTHLAVILVPLAFALASCGGDDSKDGSAPAAGTSPAAQSEGSQQAQEPTTTTPGDSGGSSSPPRERKRASGESGNKTGARAPTAPRPKRKSKAKTPQERIANLTPSERRKLHADLYEQGKQVCYAYGPKELAQSYNLTGADAETIARQYATLYESATPSLILPYQQGCMAGFRRHARNPPKTPN